MVYPQQNFRLILALQGKCLLAAQKDFCVVTYRCFCKFLKHGYTFFSIFIASAHILVITIPFLISAALTKPHCSRRIFIIILLRNLYIGIRMTGFARRSPSLGWLSDRARIHLCTFFVESSFFFGLSTFVSVCVLFILFWISFLCFDSSLSCWPDIVTSCSEHTKLWTCYFLLAHAIAFCVEVKRQFVLLILKQSSETAHFEYWRNTFFITLHKLSK